MNTREEASRYVPRDMGRGPTDGHLERWEVDAKHSRLRFVLRHFIVQQIKGEFRSWGGTLYLDRADARLSSLHVWVDLASVDTGSTERDAHIRSDEFLDVARLPRAEFDSTSIELREGHALVHGLLLLHGVTRDLDLEIMVPPDTGDVAQASYSVKGTVNRQSFGLHWNQDLDVGGVVVGDDVAFTADVKVVRVNDDDKSGG
jgi:polyisoprenoid-binding protein YceI